MRNSVKWVVAILAILIYRISPAVKSNILFPSKFPIGYIANGTFSTDCTIVTDPDNEFTNCEDVSFWEVTQTEGANTEVERRVLISCDPGRKAWNTVMGPLRDPNPHGALWVLRPGSNTPQRIIFTDYPPNHDFHPLGAEAYPSHSGEPSNLFVINHARERSVIEQFILSPAEPPRATWVRTISLPYVGAPNALALTGPNSFFVTNDHLITRRWPIIGHVLPVIETLLALPFGLVAHVQVLPEHETTTLAALGIPFANGIAVSPKGNTLAVASSSLGVIYIYDIALNSPANVLTHKHTVRVPFSPDNLSYDKDGTLIAAGHPHFPALVKVGENATGAIAPSWVVAIRERGIDEPLNVSYDNDAPIPASKVPPSKSHVVETIFQSNGTGFGSSTTGLRDDGTVYVPGLYEVGLLVCTPQA